MLIAVVATLLAGGLDYTWILVGLVVGTAIGAIAARRVQMTEMPEMVALLNGSGGLASMLVGWAEYVRADGVVTFSAVAIVLTVLIGGLAASGSVIAFAKLSGRIDGKPLLFRARRSSTRDARGRPDRGRRRRPGRDPRRRRPRRRAGVRHRAAAGARPRRPRRHPDRRRRHADRRLAAQQLLRRRRRRPASSSTTTCWSWPARSSAPAASS
jgi:hypothetical protein